VHDFREMFFLKKTLKKNILKEHFKIHVFLEPIFKEHLAKHTSAGQLGSGGHTNLDLGKHKIVMKGLK